MTTVRRSRLGPWWLWSIVLILAGGGGYVGYMLRETRAELARVEVVQEILAANRDGLQASRQELSKKLEHARQVETELRADLARAKSDGDAVSKVVGKLQKRLEALKSERDAASADAARAAEEKSALESKIGQLEDELGTLRTAAASQAAGPNAASEQASTSAAAGTTGANAAPVANAAPELTGASSAPASSAPAP